MSQARRRLSASLQEVTAGASFFLGVPAFVRSRIAGDAARAILDRRRRSRPDDFLALTRRSIYLNPRSPYRRLLALAGCEYGDLEALVTREGLDEALSVLFRQGVYLKLDEFKGRRPARRSIEVEPGQLANPQPAPHIRAQTSGSRGPRVPVPLTLAAIHDRAVNTWLTLEARGGLGWRHAYWGAPGAYVSSVLRCGRAGTPIARWFSQVDLRARGLDPRYRLSALALRATSALVGRRPPPLLTAPLENPRPIRSWIEGVLRAGDTPHLYTYVSPALRLCQTALDDGHGLQGVQLTVTGEPFTATRLAAIRRAGAEVLADYGCVEAGGFISYGCLAPEVSDDVHLFDDLVALIQPGAGGEPEPVPARALLLTSLRPSAPLILLNVSTGDQATVVRRTCGCPLERLGWQTHLHDIRSFDKLTAGGMTFLGADVIRIRVLEMVLPTRFGGEPTDYQLVEEEERDGQPRLRLLVDPAVGPPVPAAVADAFLAAIGSDSPTARQMEIHWRQAGLLRVERRAPIATATGKILHLFRESAVKTAARSSFDRDG
jgi:hypothetical protein